MKGMLLPFSQNSTLFRRSPTCGKATIISNEETSYNSIGLCTNSDWTMGDYIMKDEMGRPCNTSGGNEKRVQNFIRQTLFQERIIILK
jgi:hypothetical protein